MFYCSLAKKSPQTQKSAGKFSVYRVLLLNDGEVDHQRGKYDGNHRQQLDEDVDSGAGGILEGIAYGIADDSSLVGVAALAAVYAAFDVLLGVIPGTAGIGHEDGEQEAGNSSTGQHTHPALEAEEQPHTDGGHDADDGGQDHLVQGGLGAEVNAAGIVRIRLAVHQADDLLKLTTNLYHDGLGGTADRLHGECGKDEGQAGADEQADQYNGGHHREIIEGDGSADLLNLFNVGSDESQSGEGGRADGEALTGGGEPPAPGRTFRRYRRRYRQRGRRRRWPG